MHHNISFSIFQVLQKQMDLELELFGDLKQQEKTLINAANGGGGGGGSGGSSGGTGTGSNPGSNSSIGKVFMLSLSSQPVDHEDASGRGKVRM